MEGGIIDTLLLKLHCNGINKSRIAVRYLTVGRHGRSALSNSKIPRRDQIVGKRLIKRVDYCQ